ncbi:MAG TPA: phosphoglycerate dehydrogenase, partial [Amycolatopsis sp.]|nr:phosphoglycerate dehydrogenase [Amycolatopsis sp.]
MTNPSKPVVLIAEKLAPSVLSVFGDEVEVQHVDGTDRPALLEAVKGADALLVRSATKV